jgi:hypothetical protein
VQARQDKAMTLRIEEGKTFEEIAKELDCSVSTARKDVKSIAAMKYEGMIEKDDLVILESNARYDQIVSLWLPLLKPLIEGKLVVGETKVDREGKEYDITMPTFEAASVATKWLLQTSLQREKLNGFHNPKLPEKSPNEIGGEIAMQVLMKMMEIARKPMVEPARSADYTIPAVIQIPAIENNSRKD